MANNFFVGFFWLLPNFRVILVLVLLVLVIRWTVDHFMLFNLPPGPWGIPFLGANFRLGPDPGRSLLRFSQKYGRIFSLYIGPRLTVVITDPELVLEAYGKKAEMTSARETVAMDWLEVSGSIISCSGADVKPLRRFILRALRDFGRGTNTSEILIQKEAQLLCRGLGKRREDQDGPFFDPREIIQMAVANIICSLCFGRRFDYESKELKSLVTSLQTVSHISALSIVREIPLLFLAPRYREFRRAGAVYKKVIHDLIAEHRETFDLNKRRDVTDQLLQETSAKGSPFSFGDDRIYRTLVDMFGAGSDTTSTVLQFAIWHMALNRNVQTKVHNEILSAVGIDRAPEMSDRSRLPLTCATLNEVLRVSHPVPMNLIHRTTKQFKLSGYDIPTGTELITPFAAMNMDPLIWKHPQKFDPERFLSDDGKTVASPPGFFPFGTGSRMCLGETLARTELFLFFATMMQCFTFHLPPEAPDSYSGVFGYFLWFPNQFKIKVTPNC